VWWWICGGGFYGVVLDLHGGGDAVVTECIRNVSGCFS
jgi:hypothetical protein